MCRVWHDSLNVNFFLVFGVSDEDAALRTKIYNFGLEDRGYFQRRISLRIFSAKSLKKAFEEFKKQISLKS